MFCFADICHLRTSSLASTGRARGTATLQRQREVAAGKTDVHELLPGALNMMLKFIFTGKPGKLVSLKRSWQSNKDTFRVSGIAGIEPMLFKFESELLEGGRFRLSQGGGYF